MANESYTAKIESLPKIAKVLLFFFFGWILSSLYRVLRYTETKNTVTLVVGIVGFFFVGVILGIVDAVTEALDNKVSLLAD